MSSLGLTGIEVPPLGVGTMTWGAASGLGRLHPAKTAYGGANGPQQEERAFQASLAAGASLFDTAAMYALGASERRLGELAEGTDALVATKFPPGPRSRAADLPHALGDSLARLRRDRVDLYQHHFPSRRIDIRELMGLMADEVDAGRVRAVGVSNYSAAQLRVAHAALAERGIPLAANQVQYSLLHRTPEVDGVLDACRELSVTLIAYQPMAAGLLTGKYLQVRPRGLRRFLPMFRRTQVEATAPVIALLREIGNGHGATPGQVALRWLMEDESVLPIPGAKNGGQATSNAKALTFRLDRAEVEALAQATRRWRRDES